MPKDEPIRLLIAEDEQMLRNGLAGLDWKAQEITLLPTAKNGLQAVEIATEHTVDILLTDIRMPGCSGIEVAGFVRERYPQAEILFLSGYEEFDYAQKAISLRANNYILKPLMPREVLPAVGAAREAIRQRRADEEARHQMRMELQNLSRVASAAQGPAGETDAPTEEEITLVVSYIHKHCQEPFSLACLAEVFHFTPVYLSRLIKKKIRPYLHRTADQHPHVPCRPPAAGDHPEKRRDLHPDRHERRAVFHPGVPAHLWGSAPAIPQAAPAGKAAFPAGRGGFT